MILPYCKIDGVPTLKDSDLAALFLQMQADDTVDQVFYEGDIRTPEDFVRMVHTPDTKFFVLTNPDTATTIGFCWLNQLERVTCQGHWVIFKSALSATSLDLLADAVQELLQKLSFIGFTGIIPTTNVGGNKVMKHTGMTLLGTIPNFVKLHTGEIVDGNVYYITREVRHG